ncbi:DNA-binding transcriptional LysR family regulator [Paraburkholderia sp. GAS199]|uniref:LysR family transcriptional regulator n=1 Tax=Paraburkholderia sp. GAS199 TaxID=3035126 RepID=UPI003D1F7B88
MLPVTFRSLEVFVAVIESGGFGAAAATLGIAQPSVSVHVRDLENKLGRRLFDRRPGVNPELTDAGRAYYAYALEALAKAKAATSDIRKSRERLRFAAQRFVADQLLVKPLGEFAAKYPNIELVARSGTFEEVLSLCRSGQVDLGFMLSTGEVPGLVTEPLGRYRLSLIAAPDHPLASQRKIPIHSLTNFPFVAAHDTSYFGRTIASMLRAAGLSQLKVASQAQDMSMVRSMVIAGVGIACSLRRSVVQDLAAGTLVELDVEMSPMHLVLNYFRNPSVAISEVDALVDMVQAVEVQKN